MKKMELLTVISGAAVMIFCGCWLYLLDAEAFMEALIQSLIIMGFVMCLVVSFCVYKYRELMRVYSSFIEFGLYAGKESESC